MNLIIQNVFRRVIIADECCNIQSILINLHPNEFSQEFHISLHQIVIKLDRCVRSCNTHIDLSNKVCVPNKARFKYNWVQHDCRNT